MLTWCLCWSVAETGLCAIAHALLPRAGTRKWRVREKKHTNINWIYDKNRVSGSSPPPINIRKYIGFTLRTETRPDWVKMWFQIEDWRVLTSDTVTQQHTVQKVNVSPLHSLCSSWSYADIVAQSPTCHSSHPGWSRANPARCGLCCLSNINPWGFIFGEVSFLMFGLICRRAYFWNFNVFDWICFSSLFQTR